MQADIFNLPFAPGTFDFVYSVGVLHHLPDPQRGLESIAPLAKENGLVSIWVYSKERRLTNFMLELVRGATSRMPHSVVQGLSFVGAAVDQVAFVMPYALTRQTALRNVADDVCKGRMALVTEGGYDLTALDGSLQAVVDVLAGHAAAPKWPAATSVSRAIRASTGTK